MLVPLVGINVNNFAVYKEKSDILTSVHHREAIILHVVFVSNNEMSCVFGSMIDMI